MSDWIALMGRLRSHARPNPRDVGRVLTKVDDDLGRGGKPTTTEHMLAVEIAHVADSVDYIVSLLFNEEAPRPRRLAEIEERIKALLVSQGAS